MRRWAFVVAIIGMFVLVLLLQLPAQKINELRDLENLVINTRVEISGTVLSSRYIYGETQLLVINGVDVLYDGAEKLKGERVRVIGRVDEYNGKKQIIAEELLLPE